MAVTSSRQVYVTIACFLLLARQTFAVVNVGGDREKEDAKKQEDATTTAQDKVLTGVDNSYLPPPKASDLPVPVYGVPDVGSSTGSGNVVYPPPPPDVPPLEISSHHQAASFGSLGLDFNLNAFNLNGLSPAPTYGPPRPVYGPPKNAYGPPPRKNPIFSPPKNLNFNFNKFNNNKYRPPVHFKPHKHVPLHVKHHKNFYGPPPQYFKQPNYKLPKPGFNFNFNKPPFKPNAKPAYGAPPPPPAIKITTLQQNYGIPEPVPSGPPHPGVGAPPTPPDIKYDGWQPIPGLVSRPPHGHVDVNVNVHANTVDASFVPPVGGTNLPLATSSHENGGKYSGLSDSYGAPLNAVTGSGGVIGSSLHLHRHQQQQSIGDAAASGDVIKSIGYEIDDVGLIPPSGQYGVPPSGSYGTPLLHQHQHQHHHADKQPKRPVIFREPVPQGLIESVGQEVAYKDAHGIVDSVNTNVDAYIPPAPPIFGVAGDAAHLDLSPPPPPPPSNLFSLPSLHRNPISFQSVIHGASQFDSSANFHLNSFNANDNYQTYGGGASLNTAYNFPSGISEGLTVGFENVAPVSIDLVGAVNNGGGLAVHNCPHSQLNANVVQPHATYGVPPQFAADLNAAHSQTQTTSVRHNAIAPSEAESNKLFLPEIGGDGGELIKSQSIDFNNIPLQGALGSYTLQISPADGLGATNASAHVPHDQVLNDGLLQSILAAIEQPRAQPLQQQLFTPNVYGSLDGETQHSIVKEVVVAPPQVQQQGTEQNHRQSSDRSSSISEENDDILQLDPVDKNDIAVYFNSTESPMKSTKIDGNNSDEKNVRNGQQYGSYVSVETPTSSFSYGDKSLALPNNEKQ